MTVAARAAILVTMRVEAKDVPEFEATLEALMPLLRESEPETLQYDYYRVADQEGLYRLLEVYASREALNFHMANPATASQRETFRRLLAGPTEVLFLDPVGSK